jgi:hypothetical protein
MMTSCSLSRLKFFVLVSALIPLSLVLTGCSGEEPYHRSPVVRAVAADTAPEQRLSGTYQSVCYLAKGMEQRATTQVTFTITSQFLEEITVFSASDTSCAGAPIGQQYTSGAYSIEGNQINYLMKDSTRYDIFKLDGQTLYFGSSVEPKNGGSLEQRPSELSEQAFQAI